MKRSSHALLVMLFAGIGTGASMAQEQFIGEVRTFAFNFCPAGWAAMHGQILDIAQNDTLFSLISNRYGGDGQTTFALPVGTPIYSASGEPFLQCIALSGIYPSHN